MLKLIIPSSEYYDEAIEEFIVVREQLLHLEHSLVSLSKWESRWCKPFLTNQEKTTEETIDYIRCMTITQNIHADIYRFVSRENVEQVTKYIEEKQTATTFGKTKKTNSREIITAEVIYHWMIAFNIPFDCQKWHLNRLLTLIEVCNVKNNPPKKMSKRELAQRNADINASRRKGGVT